MGLIITLSVIGALVLIAFFIAMSIAIKIKRINRTKAIEQVTNEPFYINEKHDKEKWYVSLTGEYEKIWLEGQNFDFKIKTFGYEENFAYSFVNSKFVRTKAFLSSFMDVKSVNKTIERLKINATCLENIWWKKYKGLFINASKEIGNISKAPEYFFYKYYFKFLTGLRRLLISNLTDYIIPNTIFLEMKSIHFRQFNIARVEEPQKNILFAFRNVQVEADRLAVILNKQYREEIEEKGPNFEINYDLDDPEMLNVLNPLVYIDKLYWKYKLDNTYKKLNMSKNADILDVQTKLEQTINDLEKVKLAEAKMALKLFEDIQ